MDNIDLMNSGNLSQINQYIKEVRDYGAVRLVLQIAILISIIIGLIHFW